MILTPEELRHLDNKAIIGLTSGCFDLVHYYHLYYLQRCKQQCDFLIVGVDSDSLLTHFKAKNANIPDYHRVMMVDALKCVDAVFLMHDLEQFRKASKYATKIFKNSATLYGQPIIGAASIEKLVVIPDVEVVKSTTEIVEKIRKNEGIQQK